MFDIGFAELLIIMIVGLLVLGPERLPGAIRTGSLWLGRLRRSFYEIKTDIEREIGADEIRQQLHNESIMKNLQEGRQDLQKLQQQLNHELNKDVLDSSPASKPDAEQLDTNSSTAAKLNPTATSQSSPLPKQDSSSS